MQMCLNLRSGVNVNEVLETFEERAPNIAVDILGPGREPGTIDLLIQVPTDTDMLPQVRFVINDSRVGHLWPVS